MDSTSPPVLPSVAGPVRSGAHEIRRSGRRRRPSGEAPPLPHQLQTTGVGWLVASVVLVGLSIVVFAGGLRGPAVAVTVADDAVVRWLAGLDAPWLAGIWRALAFLGSWWVLNILGFGLVLALLALRRFRHLIVVLVVTQLLTMVLYNWVGPMAQRPRPFGVEIRTGWGGWALPSVQVAALAATLVVVLYTLVPEGRWRQLGKLVAAGVVALAGLGRVALGAEAPSDVLVGVVIGVTIPLVLFRLFTPTEVFPISYRRGRAAHLDVTGPRGAAIRQGLEDQLGLAVTEVTPFGLAGSAGSTPLRITVEGDPPGHLFGKLYARSHLRADRWYKLGRELLYGRLEDEKPFNTVRRLVQQEDYALRLCRDAGLPTPTLRGRGAHPRTRIPAGHRVLRWGSGAGRGRGRHPGHRRRPLHHPQALACRPRPPRHQAGQPAGPRRPHAADRRRLHRTPAQPLAPGRGPGQHDAVSGPAVQPRTGLPAGPAPVQRRGDHRRVRGRPRAGPPPNCGECCAAKAATCTPSSCACCRPRPGPSRSSVGPCGGSGSWPPWCWRWC